MLSQTRVGIFFAERAVVMLHIGSPGTVWKGPIPMIMGYLGTLVYVMPLAVLLVMLLEPVTGASPGKRLFRLAVVESEDPVVARRVRWRRAAMQLSPIAGLVVALLVGSWQLALVATIAVTLLILRATAWFISPAS